MSVREDLWLTPDGELVYCAVGSGNRVVGYDIARIRTFDMTVQGVLHVVAWGSTSQRASGGQPDDVRFEAAENQVCQVVEITDEQVHVGLPELFATHRLHGGRLVPKKDQKKGAKQVGPRAGSGSPVAVALPRHKPGEGSVQGLPSPTAPLSARDPRVTLSQGIAPPDSSRVWRGQEFSVKPLEQLDRNAEVDAVNTARTTGPLLIETEFLACRRRVLQSQGGVALAFAAGLAGVFAAKRFAPERFELAVALFALATLGSLALAWRTARARWRCPSCAVRWAAQDALASFHWNHCAACGAALRARRTLRDRERIAESEFEREGRETRVVRARVERRRRRGRWAAASAAVGGLIALAWIRELGLAELAEQAVVGFVAGIVTAILVWSARCPRCRGGLLAKGQHCPRCGLRLDASLGDVARPR